MKEFQIIGCNCLEYADQPFNRFEFAEEREGTCEYAILRNKYTLHCCCAGA
jgi:hypothetical protein